MLDATYPLGKTLQDRLGRQVETVRDGGYLGLRTLGDWYWGSVRAAVGKVRHGPKWRYLLSRGRPLPPELAGKRINQIALKLHREYQPARTVGRSPT